MPGAKFLEGDKVDLRTVEEDDLDFIQKNQNDPEIRKKTVDNRPKNRKQMEERIEQTGDDIELMVYADEEAVGKIRTNQFNQQFGRTELGLWISPEHQGNGYGTEASRLMIGYAFDQLRYHKVKTRVSKSNRASQKIWEKLGFKKEGELREQNFTDGRFENYYFYGVLEDEWS